MPLQTADALGNIRWGGGITNAPTRHAIGFGHAIDDDGALIDLRRQAGNGYMTAVTIEQLFIDFVGDDIEVFLHRQIGNELKTLLSIYGAGGSVGRIDNNSARFLSNGCPDGIDVQLIM